MQYHPPSWLPASENGKRTDYYAHLRSEVIEAISNTFMEVDARITVMEKQLQVESM